MVRKILMLLSFVIIQTQVVHSQGNYTKPSFAGEAAVGYNHGACFQGSFLIKHFAEGLPLNLKIGIGLSFLDPGKSAEAREIFINDATNGIPQEAGTMVSFKADFLYNIEGRIFLLAGPRFAMFTGNFNYVGGNEDFNITSKNWGFGIGIEDYFKISSLTDLVFSFGYDYFFPSTLYGHDTSYSPDGENVNGRKNFTYQAADDAINQPKHNLKVLVGLSFNL